MRSLRSLLLLPAAAIVLAVLPAAPAAADTDDFEIPSFEAAYRLSLDDEGRSVLDVTETIRAVFPETDQNRGLRRVLVDDYQGHSTRLEVRSVTDAAGEARAYEQDGETLEIADDEYVHGEQVYVIQYRQHDVVRFDDGAAEFYWDVNGTDWPQAMGEVQASVRFDDGLAERLTGDVTAVQGAEGESRPADIVPGADGTFTFRASNIAPEQTLTFAIGLEEGSVQPFDGSFDASPWPTVSAVGAALALLVLAGAAVARRSRLRDAPGRPTIVAEYLPPKGVSIPTAAHLLHRGAKSTAAQIVDLAVTGHVRIVQLEGTRKPQYRLEYVHDRDIDEHEREFLHALFGSTLTPGEHRDLATPDTKAGEALERLTGKVTRQLQERGYRASGLGGLQGTIALAAIVTGLVAIVGGLVALAQSIGWPWSLVTLVTGLVAGVVALVLVAHTPLTALGAEVEDHLAGLKEYLQLAEADRLRMLQSVEGAERIDAGDGTAVVRLYERLLPYAVLFGIEREWGEVLGRAYEGLGEQPDWYVGSVPFNPAVLGAGIGSFSTSAVSSYSAASPGSTGGAVAGGGGGGGGGGGI